MFVDAPRVADAALHGVVDLARHGELRFDENDRILNLLIGVLTTTAIVAGAYWIVQEGTSAWVVARAVAAVYLAAVLEAVLHGIVFEWYDLEGWMLLTSLSTVLFFLTFVLAHRMAFEDRDATDWDRSAIRSKP